MERPGPAMRSVIDSVRRRRYLSSRTPPLLRTGPQRGPATVYYLAPDDNRSNGGVKVLYRHVDVLNDLGVPARILHRRGGFRCTWFDNNTQVVSADAVRLGQDDVLVVPEMYGSAYGRLPSGQRTVVFNQGPYYTFHDLADDDAPGAPYRDMDNLALVMTVSDDGRELLRAAFPSLPIEVARPVVDAAVFHPGNPPTEHRVAFTTSRRPVERKFIVNALRARGVDVPLQSLAGLTEQGVAGALRSATIFLSFSDLDGFGLPPAEAMACGCYVIGYDGGGGREFLDPAYSRPVDGTARFIEAVLEALELPPEQLRPLGLAASETILERYSVDGLRHDLATIYGTILDVPAPA